MRADFLITIRPWRVSVGALLALLCLLGAAPLAHAADTVVSLEFDDATSDQAPARSMLASRNMHATFFVNSGTIGAASGFHLSWSQLRDLAADGNEITGHTVDHANMPQTQAADLDEAKREICDDRATLLREGFDVRNFAYPYGAYDAATKQLAADCGYNSARDVSGIFDPVTCDDCAYAETIPPRDLFRTRTPENVRSTTTLADIQANVTAAEAHGGGWVQLVLHHICTGCGQQYSITQSDLAALLDWLAARPATTKVKTVQEVIGGPLKPAVAGPAPTPLSGPNQVRNASLESADSNGTPTCWDPVGFGSNNATFTRTTDAHSGSYAERLAVTNYVSGAQRMFVHMDLGRCAPTVTAGNNYTIGAYYKSTARPAFEIYLRDSRGLWSWWMTTASFDPAASWDRATFTTPAVPAGTTAISFALGIQAAGTLTTDDYSLVDRGVIPPPPNTLQNANLETFPTGGSDPTCWGPGGSATGTWARTTDAHSGGNAEIATITATPTGSQDKKIVSQQDSTLLNPTLTSATSSTSGGTLADGSYYYVITAVNSRGETLASTERSATTSGTSGSVALSWPAVSGATG
jgi:peptidoglycan/xylan/chitin deacetylase (PgdA/CDA1 family)